MGKHIDGLAYPRRWHVDHPRVPDGALSGLFLTPKLPFPRRPLTTRKIYTVLPTFFPSLHLSLPSALRRVRDPNRRDFEAGRKVVQFVFSLPPHCSFLSPRSVALMSDKVGREQVQFVFFLLSVYSFLSISVRSPKRRLEGRKEESKVSILSSSSPSFLSPS